MFLYEMHCHSAVMSMCSQLSPEAMVDLYVKNGYTGIVVTDHFMNNPGSCRVMVETPNLSYPEKVHAFFEGYRQVKAAAGDRLQVFPGLEYSYKGTDILIYGLDEDVLMRMPESLSMKTSDFVRYLKNTKVLTVQAHPFREADYIDHIRLFTETDGVEVFNAGRTALANHMAELYATAYEKIKIGGSDLHRTQQPVLSGMAFTHRKESVDDIIAALRRGEGEIVRRKNICALDTEN